MINTFIAAITALFFWNKSTKDVEEKTQLSSWTRTFVYGVLTFLVLVFYIKTYQVATLFHHIQVTPIRESVDSLGNNTDTIATIEYTNRFSSGITENTILNKAKTKEEKELARFSEFGGVFMAQNVYYGDNHVVRTSDEFKKVTSKLSPYAPQPEFGGCPLDRYSHFYHTVFFINKIPSLVPLFPIIKKEKEDSVRNYSPFLFTGAYDVNSYDYGVSYKHSMRGVDGEKNTIETEEGRKDLIINKYIISDTLTTEYVHHYKYQSNNNFVNRMDFLTAADISQCTFDVSIITPTYVKKFSEGFDLPIEISPHDDGMSISSYSFVLDEEFLQKHIVNKGNYRFHVKFPTLANMQLIRSLILTTLLTALFSLFFLNLFYRIRKHFMEFKEKHIEEINEDKVRSFRIKLLVFLYASLFLIGYVAWRIFSDKPFYLKISILDFIYEYYVWIVIGIVLFISILIYCLFREAYSIKKNKKTKNNRIR